MGRITRAFQRHRRSTAGAGDASQSKSSDVRDGGGPSSPGDPDLEAALVESVHERDAAIARASEAEERARLARDRLESLAPLEHRIEIAERRALDAERRLGEISERVDRESTPVDPPEAPAGPPEAPTSAPSELRARLARTAARKRPTRTRE